MLPGPTPGGMTCRGDRFFVDESLPEMIVDVLCASLTPGEELYSSSPPSGMATIGSCHFAGRLAFRPTLFEGYPPTIFTERGAPC